MVNRIGEGRTAGFPSNGGRSCFESNYLAANSLDECIPGDHSVLFKKCGFDVVSTPDRIDQVDTEIEELFKQLSIEATLDEYIDFDAGIITSEPDIDPLNDKIPVKKTSEMSLMHIEKTRHIANQMTRQRQLTYQLRSTQHH